MGKLKLFILIFRKNIAEMQNIASKIKQSSCLVSKASANFSTSANLGPYYERPLADRVTSTSTWPVPYYHRLFKSYPIREVKDKTSLLLSDIDCDDTNWYAAKEVLKSSFKGREIVNYVEQNLN